jgi:hypothetical protein
MSVSEDQFAREARAARNQSLFREINERIEDLAAGFGLGLPVAEWICECANDACTERIQMSAAEYETVRGSGDRFLVAPGDEHVWADVECVTERNDRYWTVEKIGYAGQLAKKADPRDDEKGPLPLKT